MLTLPSEVIRIAVFNWSPVLIWNFKSPLACPFETACCDNIAAPLFPFPRALIKSPPPNLIAISSSYPEPTIARVGLLSLWITSSCCGVFVPIPTFWDESIVSASVPAVLNLREAESWVSILKLPVPLW